MLSLLYVRNFAVVEEVEITLGAGMTTVTGETGAGKSLLVDALMLLSGTRADTGMVRAGCERAELIAEFDLGDSPAARQWLADEALDDESESAEDRDDEAGDGQRPCRLRRVIAASGGSRAWINGRPATLAQMAALSECLVEIHGQHEHQALIRRSHQLTLLDIYAGNTALLAEVRERAQRWRELDKRIVDLSGGEDRESRLDLLRHELTALQRWALPPPDLDELENSHKRLSNAGRLMEGAAGLLETLDGEDEQALRRLLARSRNELQRLAELDPSLEAPLALLDNAEIQLGEAADTLNRYAQDQDLDPQRLAEVETHLTQLHDLARRHRVPMRDLHARGEQLQADLEALENAGEILQRLEHEQEACRKDYGEAAQRLGRQRREAGKRLAAQASELMAELGMRGGRFTLEFTEQRDDTPDPQGGERCEFLVSANPGQPPRPLRKVASGGELARIGLAIEVATLGMDEVPTMVFDEVDAGIGGAVAEVVGQKLRALGESRQVLCVTHLPQVAAQGHAHLRVIKHSSGDRTDTSVESLTPATRKEELARMLGGLEITRETRAHAKQMLDRAQSNER